MLPTAPDGAREGTPNGHPWVLPDVVGDLTNDRRVSEVEVFLIESHNVDPQGFPNLPHIRVLIGTKLDQCITARPLSLGPTTSTAVIAAVFVRG